MRFFLVGHDGHAALSGRLPPATGHKAYSHEMESFLEQWLLPPRVAKAVRKTLRKLRRRKAQVNPASSGRTSVLLGEVLSDGWQYFRHKAVSSASYAEFGSGQSTVFMAGYSRATIRSIETDRAWVERVEKSCPRSVELVHVDLGPTGPWGRPSGYTHSARFDDYFSAAFAGGYSPDFILIDGRFRVACFLKSLLLAQPGTTIAFDDNVDRTPYRIVEELVKPDHVGDRQAFFTRPERIPRAQVEKLLDKFEYVMD